MSVLISKDKTKKFGGKTYYFHASFFGGKPNSQIASIEKKGYLVKVTNGGKQRLMDKSGKVKVHQTHDVWVHKLEKK